MIRPIDNVAKTIVSAKDYEMSTLQERESTIKQIALDRSLSCSCVVPNPGDL